MKENCGKLKIHILDKVIIFPSPKSVIVKSRQKIIMESIKCSVNPKERRERGEGSKIRQKGNSINSKVIDLSVNI